MSSLPLNDPTLALSFHPTPLSIIQLAPDATIPRPIIDALVQPNHSPTSQENAHPFLSVTRTRTEVSIILPSELAATAFPPATAPAAGPMTSASAAPTPPLPPPTPPPRATSEPWSALVVAGPMDLSLTGILHALTGPLRDAGVPVFASSTWDTDYVLVNREQEGVARRALEGAGWHFSSSASSSPSSSVEEAS